MSTITSAFLALLDADATEAAAAELARYRADPEAGGSEALQYVQALSDLAAAARVTRRYLEAQPKPTELQEDRALVCRLLAIEDGLTEWEVGFVESIDKWVRERGPLTPAQRARAEQIDQERAP